MNLRVRLRHGKAVWRYELRKRIEWLCLDIAHRAPATLRYWFVIDAGGRATTGRYGNTDPSTLSVPELLKRIEPRR